MVIAAGLGGDGGPGGDRNPLVEGTIRGRVAPLLTLIAVAGVVLPTWAYLAMRHGPGIGPPGGVWPWILVEHGGVWGRGRGLPAPFLHQRLSRFRTTTFWVL